MYSTRQHEDSAMPSREDKRDPPYPLRMPLHLRRAIRARAELNRRSMQQEILFVLEREFLACEHGIQVQDYCEECGL